MDESDQYDHDQPSSNYNEDKNNDKGKDQNLIDTHSGQLYNTEIPLVHVEFIDAYSFRCLIEYLNLTNDDGNLVFTPKNIYYSRENDSKQVLNELVLYGHELTRYEYNSDKDRVISGLNMSQFKGSTKKIGKKDISRLSVFASGVCLQVIGSPKSSSGDDMDLIRTQRLNHEFYTIDGYQNEDEPNFTESMQKFTSACSDQASCKDDFVTVIGLDHGIIMEARQGGNLRASIKCLGQIEETSSIRSGNFSEKSIRTSGKNLRIVVKHPNEIVRYKIPRRIISALSKLTNISPNGTVKVYMQPNLPIKFVFHVSTYGKLTVYLRS
jgi:hypothetical protein